MARRPASRKKGRKPRPNDGVKASVRRDRYLDLEGYDGRCLPVEGSCLAGIDEAGRGAFAGPVVAAAVILPRGSELFGVDDSKRLTEEQREALFPEIVAKAIAIGISCSHAGLIDRKNVLNASLMAMARAVENLRITPDIILLDGRDRIDLPGRIVPVVGGDGKSLSIAAASIVAKVTRDRLMRRLHRLHPRYNFISNKGYGTREHVEAIKEHGMSPFHRRTYCMCVVENGPSLF